MIASSSPFKHSSFIVTWQARLLLQFVGSASPSAQLPLTSDRSIEWDRKRSLGYLRRLFHAMVCVWQTHARRSPDTHRHDSDDTRASIHSFSFFISLFPFFSALVQSFVPPRDLNIAFMLHRFTRRCLLRKAEVFITWKFIAHPLNRDEAKNSSLNWSCGDRDDVWLSLPCIRVARFIRKNLLRPQTLLKLASHTSGKRNPWEIYGLRWSRGEQNAIHLATEESRKRD